MAPIYTTNLIQTNLMATLLRRFIRVGQTDKTSDTNLILQTITIRFRRRSTDAFQTNLVAWINFDWIIFVFKAMYKLGLINLSTAV